MTRLPIIFAVAVCTFVFSFLLHAQERLGPPIEIRSLHGGASVMYYQKDRTARGTNGVIIDYNGTVLTADSVFLNQDCEKRRADA